MGKDIEKVIQAIEEATQEITENRSLEVKSYKKLDFGLDETDKFVFITLYDHVRTSTNAWVDELVKMEGHFEKATEKYNQIVAVIEALGSSTNQAVKAFVKGLEGEKKVIEQYFERYQVNHQPLKVRADFAVDFREKFHNSIVFDEEGKSTLNDNARFLLEYFRAIGSVPNDGEV